ncbi:acetylcholinesterase-like [Diadema antillarum]|uniref:acetylcholinesterase-like n=1 Tax=Diadema antillarum TaxID=105358 RepID=UPI003A86FCE9
MSPKPFYSLAVLLVCLTVCSTAQDDVGNNNNEPVVETASATYHGKRIEFRPHQIPGFSTSLATYTRIPFAEPPVGELRYKRPVAKTAAGDYDATKPLQGCAQVPIPGFDDILYTKSSEDCLYLDVYVPDPQPTNAAVMVWIHGGGLSIGAGSVEKTLPIPLAAMNDVIVVTFNYRLGVFGFLATGDGEIPANLGLLDQRQALLWVKENIAAFGGDPSRVTIFGESAGSWSVNYHIMSPMSAGLFSRGIMQSGASAALGVCASMDAAVQMTRTVASAANCDVDSTADMVACLRQKTVDELIAVMEDPAISSTTTLRAVVDGAFLPRSPSDAEANGEFNDVEIVIGFLAKEGSMYATPKMAGLDDSVKPTWNRTTFEGAITSVTTLYGIDGMDDLVLDVINYVYSSPEELLNPDERNYVDVAIGFFGDNVFACPSIELANRLVEAGRIVYPYIMTHEPSHSWWSSDAKWMGATHAEDIAYVFGSPLLIAADDDGPSEGRGRFNEAEVGISRQIMKYWSNFAKTGNPNLSTNDETSAAESTYPTWRRLSGEESAFKDISLTFQNVATPFPRECYFQLEILPKLLSNSVLLLCNLAGSVDGGDLISPSFWPGAEGRSVIIYRQRGVVIIVIITVTIFVVVFMID